jgi:colanic acid/amylovoran biosynthesis glycosyltransferase
MPVVATTHCDIPEVLGPAYSYLLAPERDAGQLAQCVQNLLNSPDSWHALNQQGREHVELEYDLNRQAERLISLYSELIDYDRPA